MCVGGVGGGCVCGGNGSARDARILDKLLNKIFYLL